MPKVRFDFTISMGNLLTIIGGVIVAVTGFVSIETANAHRDEKLSSLDSRLVISEKAQESMIAVREDVIIIKVNMKNQDKMLERIIAHLEK